MGNELIKTLYKCMQEIKLKINTTKGDKDCYEKLIVQLNNEKGKVANIYNNYLSQYYFLKFKFYVLSIITFGLYYKSQKYDYELRRDTLNGSLNDYEYEYGNIISCLEAFQQGKDSCDIRIMEYIKNRDQIDMFIECISSMTDSEKEKFLSYKIKVE